MKWMQSGIHVSDWPMFANQDAIQFCPTRQAIETTQEEQRFNFLSAILKPKTKRKNPMPSYTYQGRDAVPELIEPGEYVVKVIEAEAGISNGAKTRGSDTLKLKLREEESGAVIYETLIFHDSCDFKIDCFIRSTGIEAVEGQQITLDPPDLVGLRGWVAVNVDEYNDKKRNRIAVWLTDREHVAPEAQPDADPFDDDDDVPF